MRRMALGLACALFGACVNSAPSPTTDFASVQSARAVRAALARATTRHWLADVGPVTSEDLASLRKQWVYYARPESVLVEHLLVQVEAKDAPRALQDACNATGQKVASRLHAVSKSLSDEAFASAAQEQAKLDSGEVASAERSHGAGTCNSQVSIKFERLPPFARDGRIVMSGASGALVPAFVAAAFALKDGETSAPVLTEFGQHVIRRIESYPPNMPTDAELAAQKAVTLKGETQKRRIELGVALLREKTQVQLNPAAEAWMGKVAALEQQ